MPKPKAVVEILASHRSRGAYDFWFDTRLIRRNDKFYVIQDQWCGEGQIRGECPRSHVYEIPEDKVAEFTDIVNNDEPWDWRTPFEDRYKSGPIKFLGTQNQIRWMQDV